MFLLITIHKIIKAFKLIACIHEDPNILSLLPQAQGKLSMNQDSSHRRPIYFSVPISSPRLTSKCEIHYK